MSGDSDSEDKPYDPTQKKLQDARDKGNVPRSGDLNTAATYGGFLLVLSVWGWQVISGAGVALQDFFEPGLWQAVRMQEGATLVNLSGPLIQIVISLLPLFLGPAALVLLSLLAQRAIVVFPGNLEPKLSRISPIENAKKRFGRRGLIEFLKSFVKLMVYGWALGAFLWQHRDEILATASLEMQQVLGLLAQLLLKFLGLALAIAVVIGMIDYLWQRAEHFVSLKMSHKELMDELKNSEGDPQFRQRRRQRAVEISRGQMLRDVPKADVVIVNPEHYAVALQWSRKRGTAPVCVAKGVDEIAAAIRRIAGESQVPVYREPPTARALYAVLEIGDEIWPEHYREVAAAIRFAEEMRRKFRGRAYG